MVREFIEAKIGGRKVIETTFAKAIRAVDKAVVHDIDMELAGAWVPLIPDMPFVQRQIKESGFAAHPDVDFKRIPGALKIRLKSGVASRLHLAQS